MGSEAQTSRGIQGHAPLGKFRKTWVALDCASRVFMVEKRI